MASYGELKSDIAAWLIADDLSIVIPSFVRLAEDRHRWGIQAGGDKTAAHQGAIRVRDMERRARATGGDSLYLALPTDYLEHRSLVLLRGSLPNVPLDYIAPNEIARTYRPNRANHWPTGYTIQRNEIEFNDSLSSESEVELKYYASYARLADDADTNWLLDSCYGAYLFGALCEAEPYIQDDPRLALWEAKYAQAVAALMQSEVRSRTSRSHVAVRGRRVIR